MGTSSITVQNLKLKLQGNTVLDDVSFELGPNHHLAIVGESGSGKTSLGKALAGQLFFQGSVTINGEGQPSQRIAFVEQRAHFKNLSNQASFYYQQRFNSTESEDAATVYQEIEALHLPAGPEQPSERIEEWLTRLGLQHRRNTPLIQLSNGEHKRLQLIKALLHQPQILILDQPFTGLDVSSREVLHNIINHLSAETKIIIITGAKQLPACITHVAVLAKGSLKSFTPKSGFKGEEEGHSFYFSARDLPAVPEPAGFSTAVRMVNVSVQYGEKKILQNINWHVANGDKWLVKGPNGAGKSTLLSLLTGDNPQAYANEIYLFDRRRGSGESIWDLKKRIGYVSPELHWYFDKGISCYQAVASGFFDTMGLYRQLSASQEQTLRKWLQYFGLLPVQSKQLHLLSSGQQRLVLLARALVKNPPLLILDEPCQGLDDGLTEAFTRLIDELCTKMNKTVIYVSHYEHEVPACINQQLELNAGVATISRIQKNRIEAA